jgi:hypothetical protein
MVSLSTMKKTAWVLFAFFAITIGIYPIVYLLFDMSRGMWATKPPELLASSIWKSAFYIHIYFGGLGLLIGWTQFLKKFRNRYLHLHRTIGKIYLIAIFFSGLSGLFIAWYASGGLIAVTGFSGLALGWLITTGMAYVAIRKKDVDEHQYWNDQKLCALFCCRNVANLAASFSICTWDGFFRGLPHHCVVMLGAQSFCGGGDHPKS